MLRSSQRRRAAEQTRMAASFLPPVAGENDMKSGAMQRRTPV